ncbi:MAG TPA: MFS transporter [Erysipelothrix sp.]|jgi:UMF1 family MFS transporter|nr:MFS transporter [Erysipelothrix sp.]
MKLTKQERSWILYDVANSAFVLILSATIPVYFRAIAEADGVTSTQASSLFATTTSIAVLIVAVLAPILGAIADSKGMKKKLFSFALAFGILGGLSLAVVNEWQAFLFLLILARVGYSLCNVFYDSMLTDVTTDERMDHVSGAGFAWGYVLSTIPFIIGIALIMLEPFGLDTASATKLSFLITVLWWGIFSIPLLKDVNQKYYVEDSVKDIVSNLFSGLKNTLSKINKNKQMKYFMIAYFCYIDGVYTIISQSTNFGGEVGIGTNEMIIALLMTQFVAFPFAILSGKLAKRFGQIKLLTHYIALYIVIACIGFVMSEAWHFWLLAFLVGLAQGGIQSISRSYFGKLVPKQESNEYFGFFDIFGKFADFLGPLLMAFSASFLGTSRYGILALIILFVLGIYFLNKTQHEENLIKNASL